MFALVLAMCMGADQAPLRLVRQMPTSEFPCARVSGLSIRGSKWLVGGMRGLYLGSPDGKWKEASKNAVRQLASSGAEDWVLYGNGSVDKLDVAKDQLVFDVFQGAVKRPWAASMSSVPGGLSFGGHGGWFDRVSGKPIRELYPSQLGQREVTAQVTLGATRYIGTQDGLFVFGPKGFKRLGFGDGFRDTWITSIAVSRGKVLVGTYTGGLVEIDGEKAQQVDAPTSKIRSLLVRKNRLFVGGLDGVWAQRPSGWQKIGNGEVTCLSEAGGELVVATVENVSLFL